MESSASAIRHTSIDIYVPETNTVRTQINENTKVSTTTPLVGVCTNYIISVAGNCIFRGIIWADNKAIR